MKRYHAGATAASVDGGGRGGEGSEQGERSERGSVHHAYTEQIRTDGTEALPRGR